MPGVYGSFSTTEGVLDTQCKFRAENFCGTFYELAIHESITAKQNRQ